MSSILCYDFKARLPKSTISKLFHICKLHHITISICMAFQIKYGWFNLHNSCLVALKVLPWEFWVGLINRNSKYQVIWTTLIIQVEFMNHEIMRSWIFFFFAMWRAQIQVLNMNHNKKAQRLVAKVLQCKYVVKFWEILYKKLHYIVN